MKENYQKILECELATISMCETRPRLLLHSCCAPCSSYVLEYLSEFFDITLFYYNPNISPETEFRYRVSELQRLADEMPLCRKPDIMVGAYEPERFSALAASHENDPEGGARCYLCYQLRLDKTAETAARNGFDCFTTTLSISPYKNAEWLNAIGRESADRYGVKYLVSDFKKRNGYLRSIELSGKYHLYRQDYCGCIYSKKSGMKKL